MKYTNLSPIITTDPELAPKVSIEQDPESQNDYQIIKGYKAFDSDWKCNGMQYTCPGTFEYTDGEIELCKRGFHFCTKLEDCFKYYKLSRVTKIAEVEAYGLVIKDKEDTKCVTDKIRIIREVSFDEAMAFVNDGKGNTGLHNKGNYNYGDNNIGSFNRGNSNVGGCNFGGHNHGDDNIGECNAGDSNIGDWNYGTQNLGDSNEGSINIGSGNKGNRNIGTKNTGNRNIGFMNVGDDNIGAWNIGNHHMGYLNNAKEGPIYLFNKPLEKPLSDKELSDLKIILTRLISRPEYKWLTLSDDEKAFIISLPNFSPEIFADVTGIRECIIIDTICALVGRGRLNPSFLVDYNIFPRGCGINEEAPKIVDE